MQLSVGFDILAEVSPVLVAIKIVLSDLFFFDNYNGVFVIAQMQLFVLCSFLCLSRGVSILVLRECVLSDYFIAMSVL